jgi:choice-of-anchor C domain-containing protein
MKALLAGLLLAMVSATAQAATLLSGSFEDPGTFTGTFQTIGTGGTVGAWTVSSGSIDLIRTYWQAGDGLYSLDMSGGGPATIRQTVSGLIAGTTYAVTFLMSGNPDGNPRLKQMQATAGGTTANFSYSTLTNGTTRAAMHWQELSFRFVATGPTTLLSFSSALNGPGPYGPALDHVRISVVPLPAGAPLLLLAVGVLGLAGRRRRA